LTFDYEEIDTKDNNIMMPEYKEKKKKEKKNKSQIIRRR